MAISRAGGGFPKTAHTLNGTHPTFSLTPVHVGDLVALAINFNYNLSTDHVTSVSATNITWNSSAAVVVTDTTVGERVEIWWGIATSTSAANTTFVVSGSPAFLVELYAISNTGGVPGTWSLGNIGTGKQDTATTKPVAPSLTTQSTTPTSAFCFVDVDGAVAASPPGTNGTPTGYVYALTATADDVEADGINLAASTLTAPTWAVYTSSGTGTSCGVIAEFYFTPAAAAANGGFFSLMGL